MMDEILDRLLKIWKLIAGVGTLAISLVVGLWYVFGLIATVEATAKDLEEANRRVLVAERILNQTRDDYQRLSDDLARYKLQDTRRFHQTDKKLDAILRSLQRRNTPPRQ